MPPPVDPTIAIVGPGLATSVKSVISGLTSSYPHETYSKASRPGPVIGLGRPAGMPMTALVESYWREIRDGLTEHGIPIQDFVLHADQGSGTGSVDSQRLLAG